MSPGQPRVTRQPAPPPPSWRPEAWAAALPGIAVRGRCGGRAVWAGLVEVQQLGCGAGSAWAASCRHTLWWWCWNTPGRSNLIVCQCFSHVCYLCSITFFLLTLLRLNVSSVRVIIWVGCMLIAIGQLSLQMLSINFCSGRLRAWLCMRQIISILYCPWLISDQSGHPLPDVQGIHRARKLQILPSSSVWSFLSFTHGIVTLTSLRCVYVSCSLCWSSPSLHLAFSRPSGKGVDFVGRPCGVRLHAKR